MTIGSQLRDVYIQELEKVRVKGPVVEVTDDLQGKNEHLAALVSEAAASAERKATKDNFTVVVNDDGAKLFALHVYARALAGETVGGKQRDAVSHEKFVKQHKEGYTALMAKAFSKDPKRNAEKDPTKVLVIA